MTQSTAKKPLWQKAVTIFIMIAPCFAVIAAAWLFSTSPHRGQPLYIAEIIAFLLIGIKVRLYGISLGFHRGLTHKSYETYPWLRGLFLAMGCMSIQGEPVRWATDHTDHHRYADKDGDPHSPAHGFWHAHWGWLVEHKFDREINPVFKNDKLAMGISRWTWGFAVLGLIIPALLGKLIGIGFWDGFLWGGGVAVFFANQGTYWVNSGAHTFGIRNFPTDDLSTNFWMRGLLYPISWFMAWMTCGETNHNNHHAIMRSANHGMFKGQLDTSAVTLRLLEKMKLVWNVQWTTEDDIERRQRELSMTPEERKEDARRRHEEKQREGAALV